MARRSRILNAGDYPPKQPLLYAESFSPNTPEGACPTCHGPGQVYEVTEKTMVPDDSLTIRERAIAAWPTAWHLQNLRDILITLGYNVDKPWRDLPKKDRDWILFTEEQPVVPVYPRFTHSEMKQAIKQKTEPGYMGTLASARRPCSRGRHARRNLAFQGKSHSAIPPKRDGYSVRHRLQRRANCMAFI